MDRRLQRQLEEDPILEQATEWFVELQGDAVPVERVLAWQRWLAGDERHRAAYRSIESLWGSVGKVDAPEWPGPEAMTVDRYDPEVSVSAWRARRARHTGSTTRYALAASVILAVTLGVWQLPALRNLLSPSSIAVETRTGERREIRLSDGSTLTIGARSSVSATLTPQIREIRLESGEAFFDVAKDRSRPFVVSAGATAVTALGTQFNVRRATDQVVVAVAEGLVQVERRRDVRTPSSATQPERAPVRLAAGEQLSVGSSGEANTRQAVDAGAVGGWRAGKLHYLDEPLEVVVADLRRYAARDIEIADPEIGKLRITGTVFENDLQSWLRTLETAFPVRATSDASGRIVLDSAPSAR